MLYMFLKKKDRSYAVPETPPATSLLRCVGLNWSVVCGMVSYQSVVVTGGR